MLCMNAAQWLRRKIKFFPTSLCSSILTAQPHTTCMYYATPSFMVSTKGTLEVYMHNSVVINPSLSVSVLSVWSDYQLFKFLQNYPILIHSRNHFGKHASLGEGKITSKSS